MFVVATKETHTLATHWALASRRVLLDPLDYTVLRPAIYLVS